MHLDPDTALDPIRKPLRVRLLAGGVDHHRDACEVPAQPPGTPYRDRDVQTTERHAAPPGAPHAACRRYGVDCTCFANWPCPKTPSCRLGAR